MSRPMGGFCIQGPPVFDVRGVAKRRAALPQGLDAMRTQTLANYIGEEGILRPREGKMTPAQKDER